jgi:hypothetical protein
MRQPLPYTLSTNQKRNEILGVSGTQTSEINQLVDKIKEDFFRNIDYVQITKNSDLNTKYDVLIYSGDIKDKTDGYKNFKSYPYSTIQFKIGDYINLEYGQIQEAWLITSLDIKYYFDIVGRIRRCNNNLKWLDEYGNEKSYPCVIDDKINETTPDYKLPAYLPNGTIFVTVQKNADTDKLKINDRFVFGGQSFKIQGYNNLLNDYTTQFTMYKDAIANDDDLVNSIANTDEEHLTTINSTEIRISPSDKTSLLQNEEQIYTVYKYIDNIQQSDTFNIVGSGALEGYYTFNILSGNSFKVKCLQRYSGSDLTITCTNTVCGASKSINIKLKGVF